MTIEEQGSACSFLWKNLWRYATIRAEREIYRRKDYIFREKVISWKQQSL